VARLGTLRIEPRGAGGLAVHVKIEVFVPKMAPGLQIWSSWLKIPALTRKSSKANVQVVVGQQVKQVEGGLPQKTSQRPETTTSGRR